MTIRGRHHEQTAWIGESVFGIWVTVRSGAGRHRPPLGLGMHCTTSLRTGDIRRTTIIYGGPRTSKLLKNVVTKNPELTHTRPIRCPDDSIVRIYDLVAYSTAKQINCGILDEQRISQIGDWWTSTSGFDFCGSVDCARMASPPGGPQELAAFTRSCARWMSEERPAFTR